MMDISIPLVLKWNEVRGADSYDLQLLDADDNVIQEKKIDGSTEYFLTINDVDYYPIYYWKVKAWSSESEDDNQWSEPWSFRTQKESPQIGTGDEDSDRDGIPNSVESDTFHTNPAVKTLFIRPKTKINRSYEYWDYFISLFPDSRPGFADIPALTKADIEVVVIGSSGHDYSKFDNFDFDPALTNLPCHILEIIYKGPKSHCAAFNLSNGHTYFIRDLSDGANQWSWATMGYTDWGMLHHGYLKPQIFPFPRENYFKEGAYPQIDIGAIPKWTNGTQVNQTESKCSHGCTSPMNFNDNDPGHGLPYKGPPDQTVEFNKVKYNLSGDITSFERDPNDPEPVKYEDDDVLKRVIVHEIGHALLGQGLKDGIVTGQAV